MLRERCVLVAAGLAMMAGYATGPTGEGVARAAERESDSDMMCSEKLSETSWTELHRAAWAGERRKVRALLRDGHPVDDRVDSGETLRRVMAERERDLSVFFGADDDAMDRADQSIAAFVQGLFSVLCEGATALHLASVKGHEGVAATLIREGADPDSRTRYGLLSPMDMAAVGDAVEVIRLLNENGGSVNVKRSGGPFLSPLHWATMFGNSKAARKLLELGADVNVRTKAQEGQLFRGRHSSVTSLGILHTTVFAYLGGETRYGGVTPMDFLTGKTTERGLMNLLRDHGGRCAMNCDPDAVFEGYRKPLR